MKYRCGTVSVLMVVSNLVVSGKWLVVSRWKKDY
ncbi:exported hypothetical protein [Syntrophaceticus schinkii]|uniref:Uncharacterized protein n=1 Tax=Syntrophaceticus schinkii TaxID=499207 RepID=A0A0B7ME79_9FIRM|nr:exported hypothetical protein [Syntrophaceticus schinkii]